MIPAMAGETLRINEIFHSIQGESTRMGRPCVFIRLAGCNLRCAYCDTEYAFKEGLTLEIDAIVDEVVQHPTELVEITGGEPLLQPNVHRLMTRLCDRGRTVLIETSGACDISACDPRVIRILDLKTPGSGEVDRNLLANLAHLTERDEVKFVILDRGDYEWAKSMITEHRLTERCGEVLMSPVFEQPAGLEIAGARGLPMRDLAEWILADGLDVRLQTQLHKFIWDPQTRGV
jgi:7-carboxy-7-deazaguanine synthase